MKRSESTHGSTPCDICGQPIGACGERVKMCIIDPTRRKSPMNNTNPGHYSNGGRIETIDAIHQLGWSRDFCRGNILKYITRYQDKAGIEDLEKALTYIKFLIAAENNEAPSTVHNQAPRGITVAQYATVSGILTDYAREHSEASPSPFADVEEITNAAVYAVQAALA